MKGDHLANETLMARTFDAVDGSVAGIGPLLLIFLGISSAVFAVVIHRLYFHPLSSYPGQWQWKISSWPDWSAAANGSRHLEFNSQHLKHGDVVRFGPNHISFNTATALHDIYGSRKANIIKSDWYHAIQYADGGAASTFTTTDRDQHSQKRRLLSQAFSESAIRGTEPHILEQVQKWSAHLGGGSSTNEWTEGKNMATWSDYLTFDVLSDLCFGKSFGVLDREENRFVVPLVPRSTEAVYTIGYFPLKFVRWVLFASPLAPYAGGEIVRGQIRLRKFCEANLARRREVQTTTSRRDFFHYLFQGKDPDTGASYSNADLLAESILLVIAGSDTSSTCLAAAMFYLVHNPRCLEKLTAEIRTLESKEDLVATNVQESKLPYLRACIDEALRVAPPVPAHVPREVLPGGALIDGKFFPGGTIVGVSAYAIHHNEEYYPDPFTYSPERWIADPAASVSKESVAKAQSAFCPFSVGVRGCIGKNMAYMELSLAIAYLLWHYDVRAKSGDPTGEGAPDKGLGRKRKGEYQLFDHFVCAKDGPIVELRTRQGD